MGQAGSVRACELAGAEHRRRVLDTPPVVEPVAAPAPPAATVQTQDATTAVRAAQDGAVEENKDLLPALGNETLILPECLEDLGVEADVLRRPRAHQILLAGDVTLTTPEKGLEANLREVNLDQGKRTLILLPFLDLPVLLPDEVLGVEEGGAVDRENT